ncbi:MAG TPA: sugar phosphate isomerase/epimerase, partial [Clostridia bacterium]|nr:sugar phosphate isomerase/epimerase [Clostridia bacterium]
MRLSTSTNIMDRYNRVQGVVSMEACIRACHAAGYRVLDMNFCDMSNPGMPLAQENWQEWTEGVRALAEELGMVFSQSHSHFFNFLNPA